MYIQVLRSLVKTIYNPAMKVFNCFLFTSFQSQYSKIRKILLFHMRKYRSITKK